MFDRGAESNFKSRAVKTISFGLASGHPTDVWNGILDAHSYDKFDENKVSDEVYRHQPMF